MPQVLVKDLDLAKKLIQERRRSGAYRYDEIRDGIYVILPVPNLAQQSLVGDLGDIVHEVTKKVGLGQVYLGANVSDRRKGWNDNHRVPDVVVVLKNSRAVDCDTHFFGGPDFLVEIQGPGDDTEEKVPFYSKIGVRELLIIHREKRALRLLRLEGEELVLVNLSPLEGKEWLVSAVLPLAFRRSVSKGTPRTQVRRTDGKPGQWSV